MSDLTDWGGGVAPPEPPTIQKRRKVPLSVGDRRITAGWYGPCPERGCRAFVTKRDPRGHKLHALDAYAISDRVLERLGGVGVARVFVHESDDDRVLEYTMDQWKRADPVPDAHLQRDDDPQRYLQVVDVTDFWDDHGSDLYIPRDVEVDLG